MGGVVAFEMLSTSTRKVSGWRARLLDGGFPLPTRRFRRKMLTRLCWSNVLRHFVWSDGVPGGASKGRTVGVYAGNRPKGAGLVPEELDVSQARRFVELLRNDLRRDAETTATSLPGSNNLLQGK